MLIRLTSPPRVFVCRKMGLLHARHRGGGCGAGSSGWWSHPDRDVPDELLWIILVRVLAGVLREGVLMVARQRCARVQARRSQCGRLLHRGLAPRILDIDQLSRMYTAWLSARTISCPLAKRWEDQGAVHRHQHPRGTPATCTSGCGSVFSGPKDSYVRVQSGNDGSHLAMRTGHTGDVRARAIGSSGVDHCNRGGEHGAHRRQEWSSACLGWRKHSYPRVCVQTTGFVLQ